MKRISDEQIQRLSEILSEKINKANVSFLKEIGKTIKRIKKLSPTKAHQLIQILRYGNKVDNVVDEISKLVNVNEKAIYKVFDEYAKIDQDFYEQFYKYRGIPFIPYEENEILKRQTEAIVNIVGDKLKNLTGSRAIGYTIIDKNGNVVFKGIRETYESLLDEALLNVSQGKETLDSSLRRILKSIGRSGLKYLDYESGRSIRIESMVNMHLMDGIRQLHNENQKIYGNEFGSDGIEISVHEFPAEDHEEAQGRQFTNEEYERLQNMGVARDIDGEEVNIHRETKNGLADDFRPISQYNCYHYIFPIIIGVNKPEYSKEELKNINKRNKDGFEFEGKHYTMYQGTQLQRKIETEVRKNKDLQILARESDDKELLIESQTKINQLTNKYKELCEVSGLPSKNKRMSVSGYHKIKINKKTIYKK